MPTNRFTVDLAAKLGIVLIATLIAFGICEALSRVLFKIDPPYFTDMKGNREQLLIPDKELGHRNKSDFRGWLVAPEFKNRIETNGNGFRGSREFSINKEGKLRIMALGDSFTLGFGVEEDEVYEHKTAAILQNALSTPVEVLNLGVAGYGTIQELLLLQQYRYLKPDLVILGFFARDAFAEEGGNDLVDNLKFFRKYIEGKAEGGAGHSSLTRRARTFLREQSNVYRWIELYFGGYLRMKYSPEQENAELKRQAWEITSTYLGYLDAELRHQGIACFLIWIPFPSAIAKQDHSVADRITALGLSNVVLVDPLEAMRSNPMNYYYSFDSHWNASGHALAARILAKRIVEMGTLTGTSDSLRRKEPVGRIEAGR